MMMYSSPSYLTSVPAYEVKRTRSPFATEKVALLAVVEGLALTGRDHDALLRLLLGALGEEDAAGGLLFRFDALDEDAVTEGADGNVLLGLGGHGGSWG